MEIGHFLLDATGSRAGQEKLIWLACTYPHTRQSLHAKMPGNLLGKAVSVHSNLHIISPTGAQAAIIAPYSLLAKVMTPLVLTSTYCRVEREVSEIVISH